MIVGGLAWYAIHEFVCIVTGHPEQLITRVVGRWRSRHRLLVDVTIYYFAGHLTDLWPCDPLRISETIVAGDR